MSELSPIDLDDIIIEDANPSDLKDKQADTFLLTSSQPAGPLDLLLVKQEDGNVQSIAIQTVCIEEETLYYVDEVKGISATTVIELLRGHRFRKTLSLHHCFNHSTDSPSSSQLSVVETPEVLNEPEVSITEHEDILSFRIPR